MARIWEALLLAHADATDPAVVGRCRARLRLRLEIEHLGANRSECVDEATLKRIVDLPFEEEPAEGQEPNFVMCHGRLLSAPQGEAEEAATAGVALEEQDPEEKKKQEEATREALDELCKEEEAAMMTLVKVVLKMVPPPAAPDAA